LVEVTRHSTEGIETWFQIIVRLSERCFYRRGRCKQIGVAAADRDELQ
jgi:hypothetical protein